MNTCLVGVLQVDRSPWRDIAFVGQSQTWLTNIPQGIDVVHLLGTAPSAFWIKFDDFHEQIRYSRIGGLPLVVLDRLIARSWRKFEPDYRLEGWGPMAHPALRVSVPDSTYTLPLKEFALFHYFLNFTEHSHLYMTNTSSYIQLDLLIEWVQRASAYGHYSGTLLNQGRFIYASGSNRLLSRDVIADIYASRKNWDYGSIDDVSLGRLVHSLGITPKKLSSLEFSSLEGVMSSSDDQIDQSVHFRLKSTHDFKRIDDLLAKALHQRLISRG